MDPNGSFIQIESGWPATVNDITILERSTVWTERCLHLDPGEYWLADKGESFFSLFL